MEDRAESKATRSGGGYRIQLDGLRAFAVLCTVIHHWVPNQVFWKSWFPFGVAGVRLFFVLSGFLITGILLDQRRAIDAGTQTASFSLGHFFLRRVMRLVPAFYLLLFVGSWLDLGALRETLYWHIPYLSNLGLILDGRWLPGITHLWTLAVEEQFYIVWALLMVFLPRRAIVPCIVLAVATAPVFRTTGTLLGWADMSIGFNPISCLDTLGMGSLLAVLVRAEWSERGKQIREPLLRFCLWAGLALTTFTILGEQQQGDWFRRQVVVPVQETGMALFFTWLVARASVGFSGAAGALLSNPLIVKIGVMSYAIYLFHPIVAHGVIRDLAVGWSYWPTIGLSAFLTLAFAWLSWEFIEAPARRYGRRFLYVRTQ
ncbi:MAG: acyltransferase [bacterium]|nr:acyltransferase [bacterium]